MKKGRHAPAFFIFPGLHCALGGGKPLARAYAGPGVRDYELFFFFFFFAMVQSSWFMIGA